MPNAKTGKSKTQKKGDTKAADEGIGSLTANDHLRAYILECIREADDATSDLRDKWQDLWLVFQNKQDYSKKAEWQSKTCIPKLLMAVLRSSLLIERAILQTRKLFHIELDDEFILPLKEQIRMARKNVVRAEKQAAEITKQAIKMMDDVKEGQAAGDPRILSMLQVHQETMNQAEQVVKQAKAELEAAQEELGDLKDQAKSDDERFKANLRKTNFVAAFGEMITSACLLGLGILKRVWKDGKVRYEPKDIMRIRIAPDYLPLDEDAPRYIIEEKETDLATLLEQAEQTNANLKKAEPDSEGPFDLEEVRKIEGDYAKEHESDDRKRLDRLGLSEHKDRSKKRVVIYEFWGQVVSKDGKHLQRDRVMMLANEKYLIRNHENPSKTKRQPYELCTPLVYPHRGVAGLSMVEAEVKLQWTLNNLINLFIDSLTFTVSPMFEYDPQRLMEPEKMTRIFPGKRIMTKVGTGEKVVRQVETQGIKADAFKVTEVLNQEIQEGTAVTEFLTAMPGRQAKTLGEIEIKTAESHGYFDVIARKVELNSIGPLLYNSYEMLEEFTDQFDNLERYQFTVGGISLLLLQKQQIEYLVQAISIASKNPQINQWTNLKDLWERLLSIWNLDEAHREEEPEEMLTMDARPPQVQPQLPGAGPMRQPGGQ
jgi:hypothetical protein